MENPLLKTYGITTQPAAKPATKPKVPPTPTPAQKQKALNQQVKNPNPFQKVVQQTFNPQAPPQLGQPKPTGIAALLASQPPVVDTQMQAHIRRTQPITANQGFAVGRQEKPSLEREMAEFDIKLFGKETYGTRPKNVSEADWKRRTAYRQRVADRQGWKAENRIAQEEELNQAIEAGKIENMSPQQRLALAQEAASGLPGFYDKERASALAAKHMGEMPNLAQLDDGGLALNAINQAMSPVSTAKSIVGKDPRTMVELPDHEQAILAIGDVLSQIGMSAPIGGASSAATKMGRVSQAAFKYLATDIPGYTQMIRDAGGYQGALGQYGGMIRDAFDFTKNVPMSQRINGGALALALGLTGGGALLSRAGGKPTPDLPTKPLDVEAPPVRPTETPDLDPVADAYSKWQGMDGEEVKVEPKAKTVKPKAEPSPEKAGVAKDAHEELLFGGLRNADLPETRTGTRNVVGEKYKSKSVKFTETKAQDDSGRTVYRDASTGKEAVPLTLENYRLLGDEDKYNILQRTASMVSNDEQGRAVLELAQNLSQDNSNVSRTYYALASNNKLSTALRNKAADSYEVFGLGGEESLRKSISSTPNAPSPKITGQAEALPPPTPKPTGNPSRGTGRAAGANVADQPAPEPVKAEVGKPKVVKTRDAMRDALGQNNMPDTPEGKLAWISEYGTPASDTNRRLRYVFELSDGRKVSMEGVIRNTNPELWAKIKDNQAHYRSSKGREELFKMLPEDAKQQLIETIPVDEIAQMWDKPLYQSKGRESALQDWLKDNAHPLAGISHPLLKDVRERIYSSYNKTSPDLKPKQADVQYESPMLRQYQQAKAKHPDTLMAMRVGDFYEFYGKDAEVAAKELQITLTGRNDGETRIPMSGVPFHSVERYLAKLVGNGHKVALLDHSVAPKTVKGLVPREVTRVMEPNNEIEAIVKNQYDKVMASGKGPKAAHTAAMRAATAHLEKTGVNVSEAYKQASEAASKYQDSPDSPQATPTSRTAQTKAKLDEALENFKTEHGKLHAVSNPKQEAAKLASTVDLLKALLDHAAASAGEFVLKTADDFIKFTGKRLGRDLTEGEVARHKQAWEQVHKKAEEKPPVVNPPKNPLNAEGATGGARRFEDPERIIKGFDPTHKPGTTADRLADSVEGIFTTNKASNEIARVLDAKRKGVQPTPEGIALVTRHKRDLMNEANDIYKKMEGETDQGKLNDLLDDLSNTEKQLDRVSDYFQESRTLFHSVGQALQIAYEPDYTVASIAIRAKAANLGVDLEPRIMDRLKSLVGRLEAAEAKLAAIDNNAEIFEAIKKQSGVTKPRSSPEADVVAARLRTGALSKLKSLGFKVNENVPTGGGMKSKESGAVVTFNPMGDDAKRAIRQLAKSYLVNGSATDLNGVLKNLHRDVSGFTADDFLSSLYQPYEKNRLESDTFKRAINAQVRGIQADAALRQLDMWGKSKKLLGAVIGGGTRSAQLGIDASASLLQGAPMVLSRHWVGAWVPAAKAMFGDLDLGKNPGGGVKIAAHRAMAKIEADPDYAKAVKAKLGLTDIEGKLNGREEAIASDLFKRMAENGWPVAKQLASVYERFTAAYAAFLNHLRFQVFKDMAKHAPDDPEALRDAARIINIFTGRGDGKVAEFLGHPVAGTVAIAPRFMWSNFQMAAGSPFVSATTPTGRKLALGAYAKALAFMGIVYGLNRATGGTEETDPRHTGFGAITMRDGTRINFFGKWLQLPRLIARMSFGTISNNENQQAPDAYGGGADLELGRFISGKASPAAKLGLGLLTGFEAPDPNDDSGKWKPQSRGQIIRETTTPLGVRNIIDNYRKTGWWSGLEFFGPNVTKVTKKPGYRTPIDPQTKGFKQLIYDKP